MIWAKTFALVMFSTTEGEDKPLKYPTIFNTADIAVITKMDLAEAVEFDAASAHRNIWAVRPGMQILETSAKTGLQMDAWIDWLVARQQERLATRSLSSVGGRSSYWIDAGASPLSTIF